LLFVLPTLENGKTDPGVQQQYCDDINSNLDEFIDTVSKLNAQNNKLEKIMFVKDFEATVEQKYPFICLGPDASEIQTILAQSRFPSEIKRGSLFVGNAINVMKSNTQLQQLGIKSIMYFTPERFEDLHT
jgi:hypothetical protein